MQSSWEQKYFWLNGGLLFGLFIDTPGPTGQLPGIIRPISILLLSNFPFSFMFQIFLNFPSQHVIIFPTETRFIVNVLLNLKRNYTVKLVYSVVIWCEISLVDCWNKCTDYFLTKNGFDAYYMNIFTSVIVFSKSANQIAVKNWNRPRCSLSSLLTSARHGAKNFETHFLISMKLIHK